MTTPALPEDLAEFLASLSDEEIEALGPERRAQIVGIVERVFPASIERWLHIRRPAQIPPADFYLHVWAGGRGSGKSSGASHWLAGQLLGDRPADESAIVAPTYGDARDICVEGHLLPALGTNRADVDAGKSEHVERWNRSIGELRMRNGAVVRIDGADDGALRLQGHNFKRAWCEEVGNWRPDAGERAWDESLLPAVRLGRPQIVVTATPRPTQLMKRILSDPKASIARMSTFENEANLAPEFIAEMRDRYEGTRLGQRELYGELLDDVEGALWSRDYIEDNRASLPDPGLLRATAIGLDPAGGRKGGAAQALTIVSAYLDGFLYVRHSEAMHETGLEFFKRAILLSVEYDARIVLEANYGDAPMIELLDQAMRDLGVIRPYRVVKATTGKLTRAEPVAALSEQGRIKWAGHFPDLEEQLCSFTGAPGERSPDELDAFCWTCTELMSYARKGRPGDNDQGSAVPYSDALIGEGAAVPWAGDEGNTARPGTWEFHLARRDG